MNVSREFSLTHPTVRDVLVKYGALRKPGEVAISRFESKFRVTPGCWIWIGKIPRCGYGAFWVNGKTVRAHRFSYEAYVAPIPEGMMILHSCDNPVCVNPDHLRAGTAAENAKDMINRGRCRGGSGLPPALTECQVREIFSDPRSARVVAAHYGVTSQTADKIKRRLSWKHLEM